MKLKEKEKRRRLLERSSAEPAGKLSKAAASEQLRRLASAGKASLLKVSRPRPRGRCGARGRSRCPLATGGRAGDTAHLRVRRPW